MHIIAFSSARCFLSLPLDSGYERFAVVRVEEVPRNVRAAGRSKLDRGVGLKGHTYQLIIDADHCLIIRCLTHL